MKSIQITLFIVISFISVVKSIAKSDEKIPGISAQPSSYFYTGKPYDEDLCAYIFLYRNYDSAQIRWTSPDPSGFPNGTNCYTYTASPFQECDPLGLFLTGTSYGSETSDEIAYSAYMLGIGGQLCNDAYTHSSTAGAGNWTLTDAECAEIAATNTYTTTFGAYVHSQVQAFAAGLADGKYSFDVPTNHVLFGKYTESDAYGAFGHADLFTTTGIVEIVNGNWMYQAIANISDTWDFSPYYSSGIKRPSPTAYGVALQQHGYIQSFTDSGKWADVWME